MSRLEDELRRVSQTLAGLEDRARDLEAETLERREESDRLQKVVARSSEKSVSADSERIGWPGSWMDSARASPGLGPKVSNA